MRNPIYPSIGQRRQRYMVVYLPRPATSSWQEVRVRAVRRHFHRLPEKTLRLVTVPPCPQVLGLRWMCEAIYEQKTKAQPTFLFPPMRGLDDARIQTGDNICYGEAGSSEFARAAVSYHRRVDCRDSGIDDLIAGKVMLGPYSFCKRRIGSCSDSFSSQYSSSVSRSPHLQASRTRAKNDSEPPLRPRHRRQVNIH